jgi:hypothetical protein
LVSSNQVVVNYSTLILVKLHKIESISDILDIIIPRYPSSVKLCICGQWATSSSVKCVIPFMHLLKIYSLLQIYSCIRGVLKNGKVKRIPIVGSLSFLTWANCSGNVNGIQKIEVSIYFCIVIIFIISMKIGPDVVGIFK